MLPFKRQHLSQPAFGILKEAKRARERGRENGGGMACEVGAVVEALLTLALHHSLVWISYVELPRP